MVKEKLLGRARYHAFVYVKLIFGVILSVFPLLITLILYFSNPRYFRYSGGAIIVWDLLILAVGFGIVIASMRFIYNRLNIYNKRITCVLGILSRREVSILIRNVDSVEFRKTLLGRIFNYGTVVICSSRRTFRFGMIANAEEIMSLIVNAQDLLEEELIQAQTSTIIHAVKVPAPVGKESQVNVMQTPVSENVMQQSVAPEETQAGTEETPVVSVPPVQAMQKKCTSCGAVLENETRFCPTCGYKVSEIL